MTRQLVLQVLLPALIVSAVIAGIFLAYRQAPVVLEVVDAETGTPVPAARLSLPAGPERTALANGRVLVHLPRGDAALTVQAAGYIPAQATCAPPRFQWSAFHCGVRLAPQRLTIRLTDALDPAHPVPPARVLANDRPMTPVSSGEYTIDRVEQPARVMIEAPGYLRWEGEVSEEAYFTGEQALAVSVQPVRITGRVRAADSGEALAGARVWAGAGWSPTDTAGTFELLRVPVPFQLRVERAGYLPYRGPLIEETWLEQPTPLEIALQPIWTAGVVRDAESRLPVAGAVVQTPTQRVAADAGGAFRLRALEAGTPITISAPDYFSATVTYAGQETLDISLRQIKVPALVRDALSGRPLAGALLRT
ncbi:MAG: hypothetical protein ACP5TV_03215, partial [Anaerolineae bacterium]